MKSLCLFCIFSLLFSCFGLNSLFAFDDGGAAASDTSDGQDNPGMIITGPDGEALQPGEDGNVDMDEDTPGGFGEHSRSYSDGVADPQWMVTTASGRTKAVGEGNTQINSAFTEPGTYKLTNAGAVRVGDSAIDSAASVGINVADRTSPNLTITVTPENTFQSNACSVLEPDDQDEDKYPVDKKVFDVSINGQNFNVSIIEQRDNAPVIDEKKRLPYSAPDGTPVRNDDGTFVNAYMISEIFGDETGRLYVPAGVRCRIVLEGHDNDPAMPDIPAEKKSFEIWQFSGSDQSDGPEKTFESPPTFIFRSPSDETNGPCYSLFAEVRDRTGNSTSILIPITVYKQGVKVQTLDEQKKKN